MEMKRKMMAIGLMMVMLLASSAFAADKSRDRTRLRDRERTSYQNPVKDQEQTKDQEQNQRARPDPKTSQRWVRQNNLNQVDIYSQQNPKGGQPMKKSLIIVTILLLLIVCVTAFAEPRNRIKFRYQANSCLDLSLEHPLYVHRNRCQYRDHRWSGDSDFRHRSGDHLWNRSQMVLGCRGSGQTGSWRLWLPSPDTPFPFQMQRATLPFRSLSGRSCNRNASN